MADMNIAIVGPGAIGLLLAGFLQKNANLILVDYRQDRTETLNTNGIHWEGMDGDHIFKIPATCGLDKTPKLDLVIVCVKAYHTEDAAKELNRAGYSGPVLTMQNGLGNVEILRRHLPHAELIAGTTSQGATLVDVGHVRHAGIGKTAFGQVSAGKPSSEFLENLVELMKISGIEVDLASDVESLIWGKLLINVGINALTAILNVQNGKLLEFSPARQLLSDLVMEGRELTKQKKIKIPYDDPVARVEEVCRLTSKNFSSMYQDLNRSGRTEIDFINGAIVREGKALDIPCPYNESVTRIIHGLEAIKQSSS
jgi:2-dehydropantoate 2-reductase